MVSLTKIASKFVKALDSQDKANRWLAASIGMIEIVLLEIPLSARNLEKTVDVFFRLIHFNVNVIRTWQVNRRLKGESDVIDASEESQDVSTCNRTEELNRLRTSTVVQSPFFPRPYPNTVTCIVDLSAPPGFKIVLNFDFFDLEEEEE